MINNKSKR